MHLTELAHRHPDKPAVITARTGDVVTYRQLDEASVRLSRLLTARGLRPGDHTALLMENTPGHVTAGFGCQRAGLYWTPVNRHLTADEAAYIVRDCGARALIVSARLAELASAVAARVPDLEIKLVDGGQLDGFEELEAACASFPAEPQEDELEGYYMFYSSGTTGQPKGILPELTGEPFGSGLRIDHNLPLMFGFSPESVYLSPAPLYHAAPTGWTLGTIRGGGTVVLMDRFDPQETLRTIERFQVTHAQFVPAMFVRMLKLEPRRRQAYDTSSLRAVVHAAAPCPVEIKQQIIDWLGPIVHEYYSGSEGNCFFLIDSAQWLEHQGSVGRAAHGRAVVLDDEGAELPHGEVGTVWFEGGPDFRYHNDADKTARAHDGHGRSTLGDLGRLDEDGYLYLVDRRTDLIISGGVNIYPQEIENALVLHPEVADAAVVGVPDPEMGQRVRAVVQPADPGAAGSALEARLIAHCRERLAHYKCPRAVEFSAELPRTPTGKLLRRLLVSGQETGTADDSGAENSK